jgi:ABC-type multidrug transport system fused ATPase/permease subunit
VKSKLQGWWRTTIVGRSARLLTKAERRKVLAVAILQVLFGLLDLLGIAAVGMLGALAISGIGSQQPGNRVSDALSLLGLENQPLQVQATIIGLVAAFLLIGKTIITVIFSRKIVFFLSRRGARISATLIDKLLSKSLLVVQKRSHQQTVYSLTAGVEAITIGILYTAVTILSDVSLLLILSIGLLMVDTSMAISTFLLFGGLGLLLHKVMHKKAGSLGAKQGQLSIESSQKILEVLDSYRESVVSNRRNYYARRIGEIRFSMANTTAELAFMPNVSKYVIEVAIIVGALTIGAIQFVSHDASRAVAVLGVFLATSTRIAPAVLRLQQGALRIKGNWGAAESTLQMIEEMAWSDSTEEVSDFVDTIHSGFEPRVQIENITMKYPEADNPAILDFSLQINPGQVVALVGPSGAGKTTIVDVLLGVISPELGSVKISGLDPISAESKWPGALAYVPQDIVITNGTIRENVGMGYPPKNIDDDLVWDALKIAQLDQHVRELPQGLDTVLGDRGSGLSGGQKQRLGIARALFTKPRLLVLDEATSALDGETEASVSDAIQQLKGGVTVVLIAHRLSTVREADLLVYIKNGNLVASGSFQEVRDLVPDFDYQAGLMGL